MRKPTPTRYYSHSWEYPGHYEGYECHPPVDDGSFCIVPPTPINACDSFFYEYIHFCESYPFDLTDLDKVIDMEANPVNTFFNLNG